MREALAGWWRDRTALHDGVDPLTIAPTLRLMNMAPRAVDRTDIMDMLLTQGALKSADEAALTEDENELIEERLRALGYLGFKEESEIIHEEHARQAIPSAVQSFPGDLANPALDYYRVYLDYYRVYEDGWVSRVSSVVLIPPADEASSVVVRAMVPFIDDPTYNLQVRLLVDNDEVARRDLGFGESRYVCRPQPGQGHGASSFNSPAFRSCRLQMVDRFRHCCGSSDLRRTAEPSMVRHSECSKGTS